MADRRWERWWREPKDNRVREPKQGFLLVRGFRSPIKHKGYRKAERGEAMEERKERMTLEIGRRGFFLASAASIALTATPAVARAAQRRAIMPDILWVDNSSKIIRDNCITAVYRSMVRWNFDTGLVEWARVDSEAYRNWLLEEGDIDIAPHFLFGGAVVCCPDGDPSFYPRWQDFARQLTREWWAACLNPT